MLLLLVWTVGDVLDRLLLLLSLQNFSLENIRLEDVFWYCLYEYYYLVVVEYYLY